MRFAFRAKIVKPKMPDKNTRFCRIVKKGKSQPLYSYYTSFMYRNTFNTILDPVQMVTYSNTNPYSL